MKDAFNADRVKLTHNADGDAFWRNTSGLCHRAGNLPAVVYTDGTEEYWESGRRHFATGAAVRYADGDKEYWLHGQRVSPAQFEATQGLAQPVVVEGTLKLKHMS